MTPEDWSDWAIGAVRKYPDAPANDRAALLVIAATGDTPAPRLRKRYSARCRPRKGAKYTWTPPE